MSWLLLNFDGNEIRLYKVHTALCDKGISRMCPKTLPFENTSEPAIVINTWSYATLAVIGKENARASGEW
jgi:hypothetical protein